MVRVGLAVSFDGLEKRKSTFCTRAQSCDSRLSVEKGQLGKRSRSL